MYTGTGRRDENYQKTVIYSYVHTYWQNYGWDMIQMFLQTAWTLEGSLPARHPAIEQQLSNISDWEDVRTAHHEQDREAAHTGRRGIDPILE